MKWIIPCCFILLIGCKQEPAYTYQLSQTAFLAAMTDLEVAKVAAQEAGVVNRDSLLLAYKDAIATRYGLDRYALEEEVRYRLLETDSLALWYKDMASQLRDRQSQDSTAQGMDSIDQK